MPLRFSASALDLSRVDRTALWPTRSFEAIRAERLVEFKARCQAYGIDWDVDPLETDDGVILHESSAVRELRTALAIDDAQAAVLLAFSYGAFLDRLGDAVGTARLPGEDDDRYRVRIQLAPEAFASAGTPGGYLYWASSVSTDVRDVGLTVLRRGTRRVDVEVTILSAAGDGAPAPALLQAVNAVLRRDDVGLLTDAITVRPAKILRYAYAPTLCYRPGPDPSLLKSQAEAAVRRRADAYKRVGGDVPTNALDAAAYVAGVERVLPDPALPATIATLRFQAAHLDAVGFKTQVLRD